jgi:hypothetical protein
LRCSTGVALHAGLHCKGHQPKEYPEKYNDDERRSEVEAWRIVDRNKARRRDLDWARGRGAGVRHAETPAMKRNGPLRYVAQSFGLTIVLAAEKVPTVHRKRRPAGCTNDDLVSGVKCLARNRVFPLLSQKR